MRFLFMFILTLTSFSAPVFAEEEMSPIAESLFEHVLDGNKIQLLPYLPELTLPFGMTVHMLMLVLTVVVILIFFMSAFLKPKSRPGPLALALEAIVVFIRDDIVYAIMGEKRGQNWLAFFSTLFLMILVANFLGLIPAFKAATGSLSVSSALAVMILVIIFFVGIRRLGIYLFFKNFFPKEIAPALSFFIAILEFITTFVKTMVLSLRLFANMFAGHLAILAFIEMMFVLSPAIGFVTIPFAVFTYTLEVLVAILQAFVFTLLSCIFINMASTRHE